MEVDVDEMEVDSSSSGSSASSCSPVPQTPSTLVESPPPAKTQIEYECVNPIGRRRSVFEVRVNLRLEGDHMHRRL